MPPRRQPGVYGIPTAYGSMAVLDVVGVPTSRPPIGGPYIRRDRLTGRYYSFNLASWTEMGRDVPPMGLAQPAVAGSGNQFAVPSLASAPTAGNIMVLICSARNGGFPTTPSGWTLIGSQFSAGTGYAKMWYRVVVFGDSAAVSVDAGSGNFPSAILAEFTGVSGVVSPTSVTTQAATTAPTFAYSPTGTGPWLEVAGFTGGADGAGNSGPTAPGTGWTAAFNVHPGSGDAFGPYLILEYAVRGTALAPSITSPNQGWGGAAISLV